MNCSAVTSVGSCRKGALNFMTALRITDFICVHAYSLSLFRCLTSFERWASKSLFSLKAVTRILSTCCSYRRHNRY